ncbi:MAG: heavy metal-binding domain-containing protein [Gammaproteobacteria bacterium]
MEQLILTLILLIGTYFIGSWLERRHYKDIQERENQLRDFPAITFATIPETWHVESARLAQGSVVVSVDYFKRVVAGLRAIFGGRIKTYEPLLDRARREAMLRMIEDAKRDGCDAVINIRLETSRLASSRKGGKGTAGVEMLAYGTGLRLTK